MKIKKISEQEEIKSMAHNKSITLAIDFDGVIHSYEQGWTGDEPLDPPMDGVEDALKNLKEEGWILIIHSTRDPEKINDWLEKYELSKYFDGITNTKIAAKHYIDDRGYRFQNWDDTIEFVKNYKGR